MLVLCALTFRHIGVCAGSLNQHTERGIRVIGGCFEVFDCSIRQQDSELGKEISFLAQCLLDFFPHLVSLVWMNAFPHIFSAWKTPQWIQSPNPGTLVRPIEITRRCRVVDPITGVA